MKEIQEKLTELEHCINGADLEITTIREQLFQLAVIVGDVIEKMPDREEVRRCYPNLEKW